MDNVFPHPATLEWAEPEPITDDHLLKIARIVLNWGMVDEMYGSALCELSRVHPSERGELLYVLDIRKKVNLIKKRVVSGGINGLEIPLKEANWCIESLKPQRDMIAHGVITHGQDGRASFTSMRGARELPISDLDQVLVRSRYATAVARHILYALTLRTHEPLPDRPQ